ncbi:Pseudaminic acid synthase [compost metagenome]
MKCTSTYPAAPDNTNILTLPHMGDLFKCSVGISDHTMGVGVSVAAVALGATVVEKHFTLRRADGGVDSAFSLEPEEMASLVVETERAWLSLGNVSYGATEREKESLKHRRSLYISQTLKKGDILTRDNVKAIRPGLGLPTKYLDQILGRAVSCDVSKGTPLTWEVI